MPIFQLVCDYSFICQILLSSKFMHVTNCNSHFTALIIQEFFFEINFTTFKKNRHSFYKAGKACSHAAALAYKIDALRRLKEEESACTSFLCSWNDMSKKKVFFND